MNEEKEKRYHNRPDLINYITHASYRLMNLTDSKGLLAMARTLKRNLYMLVTALYPIISIAESRPRPSAAAISSLPDDGSVPVVRLLDGRPFSWSSNGAARPSSVGTPQSAQRQPHALHGIDDPIRRGETAAPRER